MMGGRWPTGILCSGSGLLLTIHDGGSLCPTIPGLKKALKKRRGNRQLADLRVIRD